jgi:RNA polymerase sigma-70 factor (ECF subfamily)
MHKLADAQRRGYAERRACRRLGMERLALDDDDLARIDALGDSVRASALLELLQADQRDAIRAHVVDELSYADIAAQQQVSEAVVRKRVSRGLAAVRARMGARR